MNDRFDAHAFPFPRGFETGPRGFALRRLRLERRPGPGTAGRPPDGAGAVPLWGARGAVGRRVAGPAARRRRAARTRAAGTGQRVLEPLGAARRRRADLEAGRLLGD